MNTLKNRVFFTTSTTGTGAITVGDAQSGFRTLAEAGYVEGDIFPYVIEDGLNWETGIGTVGASATTFSRSVYESTNSNALLSLSGAAKVKVTFLAEDYDAIAGGDVNFSVVGTSTATGSSPLTFTKPAELVAGDIIFIACMTTNSIPNVNGPQNDNSFTELLRFDTSSNEWQVIYWKVAGESEPSSWTLTHSAGSDVSGLCVVVRGISSYFSKQYNIDSLQTPVTIARKKAIQFCVWMTTTGSTALTVPEHITEIEYVQAVSTNNPRVLFGYRAINTEIVPSFTCEGSPSATYGLGLTMIFY